MDRRPVSESDRRVWPVAFIDRKHPMLFVGLNYWHEGLSHDKMMECIARRADWTYPEDAKVVAEYWPAGSTPHTPAVISIFEAEDYGPFMRLELEWSEYFHMNFFPVVSADEGLRFIGEAMKELEALVG